MYILVAATYQEGEELGLNLEAQRPALLGLDTETTLGANRVSLLQLATPEGRVYLFQLGRFYLERGDIPVVIRRILGNPEIVKVGVGLDRDAELLRDSYSLSLRSGLEIQAIARSMGLSTLSLADLGEKYLDDFTGKDPWGHRGDWDGMLDDRQKQYAAADAWHALRIYSCLVLKKELIEEKKEASSERDTLYESWITNYIKNAVAPIALSSLVNYTVNSYGPWRKKYLPEERRIRAEKILASLTQELPFDPIKRKFLV
jgi:ribonuclease D